MSRDDLAENWDPKDLYDPRDPLLYRKVYVDQLKQSMAAKLHQIWCEWMASLIQQNLIEPNKVQDAMKMLVPFHNLPPDAQRDHLFRADQVVSEFLNWKLVDQALKKGGPVRGSA